MIQEAKIAERNDGVPGNSFAPENGLDVWGLVFRHTWLVLLGPLVGVTLGLLQYARTAPVFESTSQMLIQEKLNALPVESQGGQSRLPYAAAKIDHSLVLASPLVVGQAVQDTSLAGLPTLAKSRNPIGAIQRGLSVSPVSRNSSVLQLRFRGSNADDCPQILDALVTTYRDFLIESETSVSQEAIGLIQNAEKSLNQTLEKQYRDYEKFREGSPLLWKEGEAINIYQERQAKIEDKRNEVALRNNELATQIRSLESGVKRGVDPDALLLLAAQGDASLDDGQPSQLKSSAQISANLLPSLLVELKTISQEYGRGHPKIKSLRRRIDAIRELQKHDAEDPLADADDLAKELVQVYLAALHEQLAAGKGELKDLDDMSKEEQGDAERLAAYLAKDSEYLGRIERTQKLFDTVVQRLQEISLIDDVGGERYTVQVLSPAARGRKVAPSMVRFGFSGVMMGLLAGFGLAYLIDRADQTFRNPEDVSQTLRLPLVGHVPQMSTEDQRVAEGLSLDPALVAAHRPKSHLAEAYRAVRTALYFSTRSKEHQIIQVTSPVPGDGKSTLAANLAITIAQSGKKVLLLDADFRLPVVHKRFKLKSDIGLASVVDGLAEPPQAIQQTQVGNLWAMACGPRPDNPSELLTSPAFAELLNLLRDQFDFVIVDTPPVLAVTDPSIVAARVDGVLLTVRLNKETRSLALRARNTLQEFEAHILGVVVNGVVQGKSAYSAYGGKYGGGYGYGSYGESSSRKAISNYYDDHDGPKKNGANGTDPKRKRQATS